MALAIIIIRILLLATFPGSADRGTCVAAFIPADGITG
jgi:hypothetical protein